MCVRAAGRGYAARAARAASVNGLGALRAQLDDIAPSTSSVVSPPRPKLICQMKMRRKVDDTQEARVFYCVMKRGCPFFATDIVEVVNPMPVAVAEDLAVVIFACEQANVAHS